MDLLEPIGIELGGELCDRLLDEKFAVGGQDGGVLVPRLES
jgi:hypothetical protein